MDRHIISRSSRPILEAGPTTAIVGYILSQISPMHSCIQYKRVPGDRLHASTGLDRNLAYSGLVGKIFAYPLDGVVLLTGCDKTTPSDGCCHHRFEEIRMFLTQTSQNIPA